MKNTNPINIEIDYLPNGYLFAGRVYQDWDALTEVIRRLEAGDTMAVPMWGARVMCSGGHTECEFKAITK